MGSQIGPCGPCSEIHVDMVKGRSESGASMYQLINKSEPTLLELWNIVFMEKQRFQLCKSFSYRGRRVGVEGEHPTTSNSQKNWA